MQRSNGEKKQRSGLLESTGVSRCPFPLERRGRTSEDLAGTWFPLIYSARNSRRVEFFDIQLYR
jgi:hypothetical protein